MTVSISLPLSPSLSLSPFLPPSPSLSLWRQDTKQHKKHYTIR